MALISQLGLKQLFPLSIRSQRLTQCYTATLLSSLYFTEQPQAIYIKLYTLNTYSPQGDSDLRVWGTDNLFVSWVASRFVLKANLLVKSQGLLIISASFLNRAILFDFYGKLS